MSLLFVVALLVALAPGPVLAQLPDTAPSPGEPDAETVPPPPPSADDPTVTAGGALRLFMTSRDYRTLRRLKGVMTERLQARFDHDSAPFNGKRANRIAAFDFSEKDLKPQRPAARAASATAAPTPAPVYVASVRVLWEEQGEASEKRTETITIVQRPEGVWRIADFAIATSEKIRFAETVNGVTALRMVMRAWNKGDVAAARANMTEALAAKLGDDGVTALIVPREGRRHAAYQIVDVDPGPSAALAHVRLFDAPVGEPAPIEGKDRSVKLVHKGSRWLVDDWD